MKPEIAIVGMACRYPDASTPQRLWENVLAQRRAFRRLPAERLRLADYFSQDPAAPDATYSTEAALIEDFEFDRVGFRVAGTTFRATDPAHWLALDVAHRALADAGFPDGEGLNRESTGVVVGNTLTGEFSRANLMRLRWPYVRRVVAAALREADRSREETAGFLAGLEKAYKEPFPPVGAESLAGGLANTIAGRICNHFDLKGGGYTVDGACASSLLALSQACSALAAADLDTAVAGGVDLSLDPFELVGFAKTGALAADEMRVFDARSAGFWPGEGCGMVVLMRLEDAVAQGRRVYAVIRGWGISSDGSGGITRPEEAGQLLALDRAYRRAGFGIETVTCFEGHGTGTDVGDATELRALSRARRAAPAAPAAILGSIKANIGHTKAAAGVAGLIKAALALQERILPPHIGAEPHPELLSDRPVLRLLNRPEPWPEDRPLRAGVSAMGFGGINTHLVLEGGGEPPTRNRVRQRLARYAATPQDGELVVLGARDPEDLRRQVEELASIAAGLSRAELTDLAAEMESKLAERELRAALVAATPGALASGLGTLKSWLDEGETRRLDGARGVFLGNGSTPARIGLLFSGQGSPVYLDGGLWSRRFAFVEQLYRRAGLTAAGPGTATDVAQPAVVTASLVGLELLDRLGIEGSTAMGHSLGELSALCWAEGLEPDDLLAIAKARGDAMARWASPTGAMAVVGAGAEAVQELIAETGLVVAGLNSPRQTVISGERTAVAQVVDRAHRRELKATRLAVSHAFHSPLMEAAVPPLAEALAGITFRPLKRRVISTVTGASLTARDDIRELLLRQVTSPVRFAAAVAAAGEVDLWIEVGPGRVLEGLAEELGDTPAVSLDAGGSSLRGLLGVAGAAFALGAATDVRALFDGRFTRPYHLDRPPRFLVNPCELAPLSDLDGDVTPGHEATLHAAEIIDEADTPALPAGGTDAASVLELLRQLVARQTELPAAAVRESHRLLGDLHLNSITVSQLVAEASKRLGLAAPAVPTDYARATVADVAQALEELRRTGGPAREAWEEDYPAGVDSWVRAFHPQLVERPQPRPKPVEGGGSWRLLGPPEHPLRESLERAFGESGDGDGIVLCLPPDPGEEAVALLLQAARAVLAEKPSRFVLVECPAGGGGFARTLHLEAEGVVTCLVSVPRDHPRAADWVVLESLAATGYTEVHYDQAGVRREPILRLLPDLGEETGPLPLDSRDVLLVSGGGKGIAAECALALARETGISLAILGRSDPTADEELAANLKRLEAAGVEFRYLPADVRDPQAVRDAVERGQAELGPVTAILHAAGVNRPELLSSLDESAFLRTLAPKVWGLDHLLAAVAADRLRLLVTFGSIIARSGMRGEADYAVVNEWLGRRVETFQTAHAQCRCLNIEWSVWSGLGMAERLGRVDALRRDGITPIAPAAGLRILRRLLSTPLPSTSVVVAGRLGETPTLRLERPELPLLRFLERPRVHYPGVELVVDSELSGDTDPYLDDHVFVGQRLLPAVIGIEAMAQASMALVDTAEIPVFEEVELNRPVVVPRAQAVTVRVAALVREPGRVELALRSAETAFQVDHFRARCCFGTERSAAAPADPLRSPGENNDRSIAIAPDKDLYGGLLFQQGRFQRLSGYRKLRAKECLAEIAAGDDAWFSSFLPSRMILGDPGVRDAAIHGIQASIPHATVLPVGIDRLIFGSIDGTRPLLVAARERWHKDDLYVYDLELHDPEGRLAERWEGLKLRVVGPANAVSDWPLPLLGPYVERRLEELIPEAAVGVVIEAGSESDRRSRSDRAFRQLVGPDVVVHRRPDGKPEILETGEVAAAHADNLVLAVAGPGPLGCDLEPVVERSPAVWRQLIGGDGVALAEQMAGYDGEDPDAAATRVWAARESLKKAGAGLDAPLVLRSQGADGWCLLESGRMRIATLVAATRERTERLAVAVLVGRDDGSL
ncbi:MAG: SDR family NAD(P)-dependent oxidoreductase [bacterium]|nr:SDR family NAD(P)-dependent oxidoreductase [bacterium]